MRQPRRRPEPHRTDRRTNTVPVGFASSVHPVATLYPPYSNTASNAWICPDLLRLEQLGVADGWRGHLVRGFFRALRVVTGV